MEIEQKIRNCIDVKISFQDREKGNIQFECLGNLIRTSQHLQHGPLDPAYINLSHTKKT
jgi:hypothetical protein